MNDLTRIANKHRTDKGSLPVGGLSAKNYTEVYHPLFEPIRNEPLRILEIGVKNGASLRMLEEFFPNAEIFGVDIDPRCVEYKTDRVAVLIANQGDERFLRILRDSIAPFDIVIDDGSHVTSHQQLTYQWLAPVTRKYYIVEDLHAEKLPKYHDAEQLSSEYFRERGAKVSRSLAIFDMR